MAPFPKKRSCLSLKVKKEILDEVKQKNLNKTAIAKKYGIAKSTLSTILKFEEKVQKVSEVGIAPGRKRTREAKFPKLETALTEWLKMMRGKNIPINGSILKEKADMFALRMHIEGFKCSDGWLQRFKSRHGLTFKKLCGESASVDQTVTNSWKEDRLQDILADYSPNDIFNADESGLMYKLLPDRTFVFKGETCSGGKRSKERITLLMCANMSGTEKLPLLVIGNSQKPRCFKGIPKLPVTYKANKKAWMTGIIYEEWIRDLDRKFASRDRKVLLIVDNCTAHVVVENLRAITVEFLPPNQTSVLQPLDQGIIQCLKTHYRRALLKRMIVVMENDQEYVVNLLQAIHLACFAWKEVSQETIANCFRHAGFVPSRGEVTGGDAVPEDRDESEDDDALFGAFQRRHEGNTTVDVTFNDYIRCDENIVCTQEVTEQSIINHAIKETRPSTEVEEHSSDDEEPEMPKPKPREAAAAVSVLRRFFEDDLNDYGNIIATLEKHIFKIASKKMKQLSLTSFFEQ